jgi:protein-tyrosine phosphatase
MPARNVITFVCTANICRSPMAEGLLAHALQAEPEPLRSLKTVSAGISAYGGDPASPNTLRVLESVGIDLRNHVSQQISQELIDRSFAIFCMTSTHRMLLETHYNPSTPHIYLMREFLPPGVEKEISDPYGFNRDAYEACRDSMVEALPSILAFLRREYSKSLK